jgi:hypothetical protein
MGKFLFQRSGFSCSMEIDFHYWAARDSSWFSESSLTITLALPWWCPVTLEVTILSTVPGTLPSSLHHCVVSESACQGARQKFLMRGLEVPPKGHHHSWDRPRPSVTFWKVLPGPGEDSYTLALIPSNHRQYCMLAHTHTHTDAHAFARRWGQILGLCTGKYRTVSSIWNGI